MAERRYNLSEADRRILRDVVRRVGAGRTSSRPTPTRRTPRGGGGGSTLRYAEVTVEISAESGGTVGSGEVQPKKNDGGSLVSDGDPVAVVNLHPLTFAVGWRGYIDAGKTPPEAVVFTCAPE